MYPTTSYLRKGAKKAKNATTNIKYTVIAITCKGAQSERKIVPQIYKNNKKLKMSKQPQYSPVQ